MAKYLLIESRDSFETNETFYFYGVALGLVRDGHAVTLFLVQNGVLSARASVSSKPLEGVVKAGVQVLADDFSLRERGIPFNRLVTGVQPSPLEVVIEQLAEGRKALWH